MPHPDLCPYCRAPISVAQRAKIGQPALITARCTCPVGFGQTVDAACPFHGARKPPHTITGLSR